MGYESEIEEIERHAAAREFPAFRAFNKLLFPVSEIQCSLTNWPGGELHTAKWAFADTPCPAGASSKCTLAVGLL